MQAMVNQSKKCSRRLTGWQSIKATHLAPGMKEGVF
jgi:hypothetical protein